MAIYPLTQSQLNAVTTAEALAFVKSPTLLARRFAEILSALNISKLTLLTNSARPKVVGLEGYGLEITGTRPFGKV